MTYNRKLNLVLWGAACVLFFLAIGKVNGQTVVTALETDIPRLEQPAFDMSAYYEAKSTFARFEMEKQEMEARQLARMAALSRRSGGTQDPIIEIYKLSMEACDGGTGGGTGFWSSIAGRMGKGKQCREKQLTARFLLCSEVSTRMHSTQVAQACMQMANQSDKRWTEFWKVALKSGLSIAGMHYAAGAFSEVIGLAKFSTDVSAATAQMALQNGANQQPFIVPQPTDPVIINDGEILNLDPDQ